MNGFVIQSALEILIAAAIILGFFFEDRLVRLERRLMRKLRRRLTRRLNRRLAKHDHSFRTARSAQENAVMRRPVSEWRAS